jgi:hypothetical protein
MALVPVSLLFEILFAVISILLLERPYNLSKIVAIGMWLFVINLVFLPQQFYTDASGTLTLTTIAFPAAINGFVIFGLVIVWIYECYNAYAFSQNKAEW